MDLNCVICQDLASEDAVETVCGHIFCFNCIENYKEKSCPSCRTRLKYDKIKSNIIKRHLRKEDKKIKKQPIKKSYPLIKQDDVKTWILKPCFFLDLEHLEEQGFEVIYMKNICMSKSQQNEIRQNLKDNRVVIHKYKTKKYLHIKSMEYDYENDMYKYFFELDGNNVLDHNGVFSKIQTNVKLRVKSIEKVFRANCQVVLDNGEVIQSSPDFLNDYIDFEFPIDMFKLNIFYGPNLILYLDEKDFDINITLEKESMNYIFPLSIRSQIFFAYEFFEEEDIDDILDEMNQVLILKHNGTVYVKLRDERCFTMEKHHIFYDFKTFWNEVDVNKEPQIFLNSDKKNGIIKICNDHRYYRRLFGRIIYEGFHERFFRDNNYDSEDEPILIDNVII
jgi:hypothetical protein